MAKIHVNLHQGIIDIEGDETFVREAFAEIREAISGGRMAFHASPTGAAASTKFVAQEERQLNDAPEDSALKVKPKAKPRVKSSGSGTSKGGVDKYYKAKLDPNLDLSALPEYASRFNPKSNYARNLVFAAFLRDNLNISPCNIDQIYSCYWSVKNSVKLPEAFGKNLMDSRAQGYLTFTDGSDIEIPTVGENALTKMAKEAGPVE